MDMADGRCVFRLAFLTLLLLIQLELSLEAHEPAALQCRTALQRRTAQAAKSLDAFAQKLKDEAFAFETLGAELLRCSDMVSRDAEVRAEITVVRESPLHRLVCTSAGLGIDGTLVSAPAIDLLRELLATRGLALTDREVGAADGEYVIKFPKSDML